MPPPTPQPCLAPLCPCPPFVLHASLHLISSAPQAWEDKALPLILAAPLVCARPQLGVVGASLLLTISVSATPQLLIQWLGTALSVAQICIQQPVHMSPPASAHPKAWCLKAFKSGDCFPCFGAQLRGQPGVVGALTLQPPPVSYIPLEGVAPRRLL